MSSVCILDYGSGNIKSVFNLFTVVANEVIVSNSPDDIMRATHLVLPGVGAFGAAMTKIREKLPIPLLEQVVLIEKKPLLGICVGMQVFAEKGSEFGDHEGLGWIKGSVKRIESNYLPLPHIGWNDVSAKQSAALFDGLGNHPNFYFVHSFAFEVESPASILATTTYGSEFCAAVKQENLIGVQFHPEKSQRAGLRLAANFLQLR